MNEQPGTTRPSNVKTDWPALLKDNSRRGGQAGSVARAPSHSRWQTRVGSSIRSAPVLGDRVLYVLAVGGTLHAIDIQSGRPKWKFEASAQAHSTPSLWKDRVLFGCDDGKVYAVDCDSGTKVWEAAAEAEVWTSPVIRNGVVFFGSADARLYAVEAETGSRRWTQECGGRITPHPGKFCGALQQVMALTPRLPWRLKRF